MSRATWGRVFAMVVLVGLLAGAGLWFIYRPWALNWGASREEVALAMPGDSIVSDPTFNATRAVTIDATPAEIWPWIVQMGYRTAGFYSYDQLDNDGIPSADHLIPERQHLDVGDSIPLTAHDYVTVTAMESDSSMLWEYAGDDTTTVFTWAWGLYPREDLQTRLVTRLRYRASSVRSQLMLEFFEIIMMRKCLLGIRQRAERGSTRQGGG
jgi:hypothetical protein